MRHFAKKIGVGIRRVVARDQVFEPRDVQRFQRSRKRDRILDRPAWSAIKGQPDLIAQHLLHGFDAGDHMVQAAFRHHAAIGMRCSCPRRFVVPAIGHGGHHRRIVKSDRLLDQREALFGFLHLGHVLGVVLRRLAGHGEADASVVDADAVANLAAEQFIYRHSGHLPRDVPQSDLDRAHRRAPGLERTQPADLQHHALRRPSGLRREDSPYRRAPSA